jgi:hypothetical protein
MFRRGPVIVLSLVLGAAAPVIAPSAMAGDGGAVKDRDPCGDGAIKMVVEPYGDGRFQVTGIVFSQDGDVWSWRLRHDDELSADGEVRADGDGEGRSFKIVRTMVDLPGSEFIAFRAENERTGLTCRAEKTVG